MSSGLQYTLTIDIKDGVAKLEALKKSVAGVGQAAQALKAGTDPAGSSVKALGDKAGSAKQQLGALGEGMGEASTTSSLLAGAAGGLAASLGQTLLAAAGAAADAFKQFVSTGFEFNASLESARIGVAAVIRQFDETGSIGTFRDAMRASERAVEALRIKAAESPATFGELLAAFQATSGAAMSANIPIGKHITLVTQLSQALAGLGIRSEQLTQEINALIKGMINEDAAAAKTLGITREMIETQREQGTLYEFLMEKTAAFAEAGVEGAKTYNVAVSNLTDNYENLAATVTKDLFRDLTVDVLALNEALKDPQVIAAMQILGEHLAASYEALKNFVAMLDNIPSVKAIKWAFGATYGQKIDERAQGIRGEQFAGGVASIRDEIASGVASPKDAQSLRDRIDALFAAAGGDVPAASTKLKESLLASLETASGESATPKIPSPAAMLAEKEGQTAPRAAIESGGVSREILQWLKSAGNSIAKNTGIIAGQDSSAGNF